LFLVLPRTPAAGDEELDPVLDGTPRSAPDGTEQIGVEVGHPWVLAVKHGDSIGEESVSLPKCSTVLRTRSHLAVGGDTGRLAKRTRGLAAKDGDG
jgi:hypothetical protein